MTRKIYDKPKKNPALEEFYSLIQEKGLYLYFSVEEYKNSFIPKLFLSEDGCGAAEYLALYPVVVGGYSGGNCWNDEEPRRYEYDDYPDIDDFIVRLSRLGLLDESASYFDIIKFKKEKIEILKWTEVEYYGNSTDYVTVAVKIKITNYNGEYKLSLT